MRERERNIILKRGTERPEKDVCESLIKGDAAAMFEKHREPSSERRTLPQYKCSTVSEKREVGEWERYYATR